jgi:hypothetical protein
METEKISSRFCHTAAMGGVVDILFLPFLIKPKFLDLEQIHKFDHIPIYRIEDKSQKVQRSFSF